MCNNSNNFGNCRINCYLFIPAIFAILLALVIGVFVGATYASFIVENMFTLAVLGIVFLVPLIVWIIVRICRCRSRQ